MASGVLLQVEACRSAEIHTHRMRLGYSWNGPSRPVVTRNMLKLDTGRRSGVGRLSVDTAFSARATFVQIPAKAGFLGKPGRYRTQNKHCYENTHGIRLRLAPAMSKAEAGRAGHFLLIDIARDGRSKGPP